MFGMTYKEAMASAKREARKSGRSVFVIHESGEYFTCEESMIECYFPGVSPRAIPAIVHPCGEIE